MESARASSSKDNGGITGIGLEVTPAGDLNPPLAPFRERLSWALYDFANTVFSMNIATLYFAAWLVADLGHSNTLYAVANGVASGLVVISIPVFGAISDATQRRKPWVVGFTLFARSRRSPGTAFRNGRSTRLCRFDHRSSSDVSFLHRPDADPRRSSRQGREFSAGSGSLHLPWWTCFHIRSNCASLPAFLASPDSLLPRSQRAPWKEADCVEGSISRCQRHSQRGQKIPGHIEIYSHVLSVSGCHGNDHREHGALRNFRDGIR